MGLEAATFISQLVAANPVGATDPKSQGDDHLRLIKSVLQASFPNISGAVTSTHTQLNYLTGATGITGTGNTVRSDSPIFTTKLLSPDGSAALPAYTFNSDPDTGIYRAGANNLAFATGGAVRMDLTAVALTMDNGIAIYADIGSSAVPSISFSADPDTGIYRDGANAVGIAANGARVGQFSGVGLDMGTVLKIFSGDGAIGAPSFAFSSDPDTGIYRNAANDMRLVAGGVINFALSVNGTDARLQDGAVATPALFFLSDTDTGFSRPGANTINVSTGGVLAWQFGSGIATNRLALYNPDGTAAAPSYTFENDPDTGLYRDTANQIAIALAGVTAGQIAQGTFNLAITGGVNSACSWQRIGHKVTLRMGAASAVSGSTVLIGTGLPAIIQPTAAQICYCHGLDNSISSLIEAVVSASGTITFQFNFNSAGFTAAGNKGVGNATGSAVIEYLMV